MFGLTALTRWARMAGTFGVLLVAAPARADDEPIVHVRFPLGTYLPYLDQRTTEGWQLACRAPCDRALDPRGVYRIRGRTGNPSAPFALPPARRVDVDASVGTPAAGVYGAILAIGGGTVAVGSAALAVWPSDGDATDRRVVGVGGIVVGAVTTALGVFLWQLSRTDVTVTRAASASSVPRPSSSGIAWSGTGIVF